MALLLVIAFLRLWLGAKFEMQPAWNDSSAYAGLAANYFGKLDGLPAYPPGVAFLPNFFGMIGLPYKLGLDLLMLGACSYAARWGVGGGRRTVAAGIALAVLSFHPWFLQSSVSFMTESVVALVLLALIVTAARMLNRGVEEWDWRLPMLAGLLSAFWVLLRPETPVALLLLLGLTMALWFRNGLTRSFRQYALSRRIGIVVQLVLPFFILIGSTKVIAAVHWYRFGVAAKTAFDAPGYNALVSALYSIAPRAEIRFSPVPRESLEAAILASPTLARNADDLREESGSGEIGTNLNWILLGSFSGTSAAKDEAMGKAAAELKVAQREGRLSKRFAVYPIDPLIGEWLPALPRSFFQTVYQGLGLSKIPTPQIDKLDSFPSTERINFENALLLRGNLNYPRAIALSGRASGSSPDFLTYVMVRQNDVPVAVSLIRSIKGNSENRIFNLRVDYPADGENMSVEFYSRKGLEGGGQLKFGKGGSFQVGDEKWKISAKRTNTKSETPERISKFLINWYWAILVGAFLLCGALSMLRSEVVPEVSGQLIAVALAAYLIFFRSLYYSLVDAWLNWTTWRYAGPNSLVFALGFLCLAVWLGSRISASVRRPS